jgi:HSP20 family protein
MRNRNLPSVFRNELIPSWFSDDIDVLFRNFFENDDFFRPAVNSNVKYPVDTYETEKDLNIEIAVVGIDKNDIHIDEEDGILHISYDNRASCENKVETHYYQRGIAKRAFNFGWKIADDKFDVKKIEATMDKGILKITIPKYKEDEKPTSIKNTIQIK